MVLLYLGHPWSHSTITMHAPAWRCEGINALSQWEQEPIHYTLFSRVFSMWLLRASWWDRILVTHRDDQLSGIPLFCPFLLLCYTLLNPTLSMTQIKPLYARLCLNLWSLGEKTKQQQKNKLRHHCPRSVMVRTPISRSLISCNVFEVKDTSYSFLYTSQLE